jgi:hypothetical protein
MSVDVSVSTTIAAEPTDVAGVMFDPNRDREWLSLVSEVDVLDPAIKPGARVRRTGTLLGRTISWTTEVASFHFPHALSLRIVDAPFSGTLTYQVQRAGAGSSASVSMRLDTSALGPIPPMMIESPLRTALTADLAKLKSLIEGR